MIFIVPESLGSALVARRIAIVIELLWVGITLVTLECDGIISQTELCPDTETEYVSMDEPLLWIVKVILVTSPGDKITWLTSVESPMLGCALDSGTSGAIAITMTKMNAFTRRDMVFATQC